ncbi:multidrug resistance protein [Glonium stellatum]|uniref:Multidrug resistance protein n=1 Tax=Glonium stellatum TaxID=574774 RepID=A0A8E2ENL0_9PEZI|nr:multidrug resistance protein [Glonium stellatum]
MAGPGPDSIKHAGDVPSVSSEEGIIRLAALEGHDADIPSNAGVIHENGVNAAAVDVEKGPQPAELAGGDPNIVWWDGDNDPENPLNWKSWKKWSNVYIVAVISFVTPLASSCFAPAVPQVMQEFHSTNSELAPLVVSVYVLGFAFGPLVIAPLSEMYGRLRIYFTCNILFVVFTVACALSTNLNMLIGFRFIEGCVGSAPLSLAAGTIADIIEPERRGSTMSFLGMGPLLGPIVGPVAGGYLSQAKGWRWVFWLLAIIGSASTLAGAAVMSETYAPAILERKTRRLRKESGNAMLRSKLDTGLGARALFARSIIRPMKLLFLSPITFALSVFTALGYGYLYLLFTTFADVYGGQYGFSTGTIGLTFLGMGIGSLVGLAAVGLVSDRVYQKKAAGGKKKPEYRLLPMVYFSPFMCVGLFWYGWSAQARVFWLVPIIGTSFFGFGLFATMACVGTYLVDAFTVYAASAAAANAVLRSVFGAMIPLFGQSMYTSLGIGWGNSLLAFVALAMCPIPLIFYRYGETVRLRWSPKL